MVKLGLVAVWKGKKEENKAQLLASLVEAGGGICWMGSVSWGAALHICGLSRALPSRPFQASPSSGLSCLMSRVAPKDRTKRARS